MVRRIQRRTLLQWKLEIQRIRRMAEAVELEAAPDVALTTNVVVQLETTAALLTRWVALLDIDDDSDETDEGDDDNA